MQHWYKQPEIKTCQLILSRNPGWTTSSSMPKQPRHFGASMSRRSRKQTTGQSMQFLTGQPWLPRDEHSRCPWIFLSCKRTYLPLYFCKQICLVHLNQDWKGPCASQSRLERSLQQPGTCQAWQQFCRTYEDTVDQALFCNTGQRLLQKFRGRGQPKFVAKHASQIQTKAARHGEFHASGDESTVLLRQRIRQIRRIQTYVGQRKRLEQVHLSATDRTRLQDACCATWRSVYSANGCAPNFRSWWLQEVRDDFPLYLPSASEAHDMVQMLKTLEPQWRQVCRRHRDARLTSVFC